MTRLLRLIALSFLLLLLATPALAQGRVVVEDTTGRLDQSAVERAAQNLASKKATVVVLVSDRTGGDAQSYANQRLRANNIQANPLDPSAIIYLVALDQRNVFIYYGADWNATLGPTYKTIADRDMIPQMARGNITEGVVAGINGTISAIDNPPGSGPDLSFLSPILWAVVGLVVLAVIGPIAWRSLGRRRQAARAFAQARQDAEDARKQAGAAIADMGQEMQNAQAKAEYDQVSYPAAEVQALARIQGAAEAQFVKAQQEFDQIGETLAARQQPTEQEYQSTAGAYRGVVQMVAEARKQLEQAEARRAELDKINAAAPGEIDRAKKALADAAERLQALDHDFDRPDAITQPSRDMVARAESLLAEHRAADTIAAAGAASAVIDDLSQILTSYADIREGISAGRAGAEKAAAQGYRVEAGLAALNTAEGLLRQAAKALQRDVTSARDLLQQAEAARAEGVARGGGMPALRRANDERLPQVEQAGEQLATYIAEGRKAFDLVDEFAENTWSDIRGNGSEAEAAAARAHSLWERASRRNTMEEQDFLGAKEDLDEAGKQIAFARTLVDSIMQRLKDLETARDNARQEIASAQADIEQGWGYVHSNDPDVGKVPEQSLAQAAELIKQASAELARDRPDWLAIVKQAQEANRLADQALANARGEVEAMNKLREQATHAQQLATAEVQKIVQFVSLHGADIPANSEQKLARLQTDVQQAYGALKAAERSEEQARAGDLREALTRYTALQDSADKLYDEIYGAFQHLEELRRQVEEAARAAAQAIARAEQVQMSYGIGTRTTGDEYLQEARAALSSIGEIRSEADMKRGLAAAEQARKAAQQAESIFRSAASAQQRGNNELGDFIGGVVVGSLLSGGGGHHDRRGGGSWGSGGGSWGSGGGSSGGWGGGGGGGWSGGGGGGGGWGGGGGGGSGW